LGTKGDMGMCTQRKDHVDHSKKVTICKPRQKASEETKPTDTLTIENVKSYLTNCKVFLYFGCIVI
jgi:hypothetical protein